MNKLTLLMLFSLQTISNSMFCADSCFSLSTSKTEITSKGEFFDTLRNLLGGQKDGQIDTTSIAGGSSFTMETNDTICEIINNVCTKTTTNEKTTGHSPFNNAQRCGIENPGDVSTFLLRLKSITPTTPTTPPTSQYRHQRNREQFFLAKIAKIIHCLRPGTIISKDGTVTAAYHDKKVLNYQPPTAVKTTQTNEDQKKHHKVTQTAND